MSFYEEMANLGENMVRSCNNRIHRNGELIKGTRNMIKKFHFNNRETAKNLRDDLSEYRTGLTANVKKLLRRFRNEHREMAKNQRDNLGDFTGSLSSNVRSFLGKCHKNQMGLHNMFKQAHKNFINCMGEIERRKAYGFTSSAPNIPSPNDSKNARRGKRRKTTH